MSKSVRFSPIAAAARPEVSFAVYGLAVRDEMLFKSIVRLLDHRTPHRWIYSSGAADVRVCGEQLPPPDAVEGGELLLWLGGAPREGMPILRLPLQPSEVEEALNKLGAQALLSGARSTDLLELDEDTSVRLVRWPDASLLAFEDQVQLATHLAESACTPRELSAISGIPVAECLSFVRGLIAANVMESGRSPARRPIAVPVKPKGLLARARAKLGQG